MYSYEIDAKLKMRNYSITSEELKELQDTSNQIVDIKLKKFKDVSSLYQMDTNDGYCWNMMVSNR